MFRVKVTPATRGTGLHFDQHAGKAESENFALAMTEAMGAAIRNMQTVVGESALQYAYILVVEEP